VTVTVVLTCVGVAAGVLIGLVIGRRRRASAGGRSATGVTRAIASTAPELNWLDVLDDHPTGVVVADRSGVIQYRNAVARRWAATHIGVLLAEAVERHLAVAGNGRRSDEVVEFFGPPKSVFEVSARPLPDQRSVAYVADVSESRRVERVRTDFVSNVSHELKTPIGALSVLAEMLVDETDHETIRRVASRMMAETERANRTIDDLLELSRIESGGDTVREQVRLADVIRGACDRVTELAAQRQIAISALEPVDAGGQVSESFVVLGDRRQLVSAVGNLVENAVKYSEPGGSVQIRARRNGAMFEVTVSDQGPGIPKAQLDRVFERFYRVDRARSRATGGTGLGLSIVKHVATNHGGEVLVASTEGEGSTFVLRLPSAPDASSAADAGAGHTSNRTTEGIA
jgi:two-component system sensor histidine kinase SenX3